MQCEALLAALMLASFFMFCFSSEASSCQVLEKISPRKHGINMINPSKCDLILNGLERSKLAGLESDLPLLNSLAVSCTEHVFDCLHCF